MARGGRDRRIGQELQRLLPELIREIKDPRVSGIVTVTGVTVSPDLAHARVFVTVLSSETHDLQPTIDGLNRSASFLRSRLSQLMVVRSVPTIRFEYDESVERGVRLTRLIESAVDSSKNGDQQR